MIFKAVAAMVGGLIAIVIFFYLMPVFTSAADTLNQTANISQYQGFGEFVRLSPLIVLIGGIGLVGAGVWWMLKGRS